MKCLLIKSNKRMRYLELRLLYLKQSNITHHSTALLPHLFLMAKSASSGLYIWYEINKFTKLKMSWLVKGEEKRRKVAGSIFSTIKN